MIYQKKSAIVLEYDGLEVSENYSQYELTDKGPPEAVKSYEEYYRLFNYL